MSTMQNWIFEDQHLTPVQKLTYLALICRAYNGITEGGVEAKWIAAAIGVSTTTARRTVRALEEIGLIESVPQYDEHGGRRANNYRVYTAMDNPFRDEQ